MNKRDLKCESVNYRFLQDFQDLILRGYSITGSEHSNEYSKDNLGIIIHFELTSHQETITESKLKEIISNIKAGNTPATLAYSISLEQFQQILVECSINLSKWGMKKYDNYVNMWKMRVVYNQ